MAKIKGQLKSIWPDRTMYKPYAYNLEMQNVFLEIDIPDSEVRYENVGSVAVPDMQATLTLNGFTCLLGTIADAIDTMHTTHTSEITKSQQQKNRDLFNKGA